VHRDPVPDSTPAPTLLAFPLPQALTRLTFMGVLILGTLSGFGAVRNASVLWSSCLSRRISTKAAGKRKAGITEEDLTHAEGSLRRVRGELEDRRAQLTRLASSGASDNKVSADSSKYLYMNWLTFSFRGGGCRGYSAAAMVSARARIRHRHQLTVLQKLLLSDKKSRGWKHWKRKCPKVCPRCVCAITEKHFQERWEGGGSMAPFPYSESIALIEFSPYVDVFGHI
jgi:hypothetical protein